MDKIQLSNKKIEVEISKLGAEIQSIRKIGEKFNYIWDDKGRNFWGRHAPFLFPIIGRLNNDEYKYADDKYHMTQHGFLRDQIFKIIEQGSDYVLLEDTFNDETLTKYPFKYRTVIKYQIKEFTLHIQIKIENIDSKKIYFSLGFHPGFNLEKELSNYWLSFTPNQDKMIECEIDPAPFLSGKTSERTLDDEKLLLNHPMLDDGLKIFSIKDIDQVKLQGNDIDHGFSMDISQFPYLTIWSPENKNAPFICVEPFDGLPDIADKYKDTLIVKKEGIDSIHSGSEKLLNLSITL